MKKRITKKELFSSFTNIKSARAYELQSLLFNHEPIGYACGSCGWDYDIYEVYGVTICTGYRNTPKNELKEVELYEQKAKKILSKRFDCTKKDMEKIENLLKEFCILNGGNA